MGTKGDKMNPGFTTEVGLPDIEKEHCENCCYYVDGVKEAQGEAPTLGALSDRDWKEGNGSERDWKFQSMFGPTKMFPVPGYRHYRKSAGSIYDRLGTTVPCNCVAGLAVAAGRKPVPFHSRSIRKQEPEKIRVSVSNDF